MQFTKHVHADLIKEFARQHAEGELECFCWEYYDDHYEKWVKTVRPSFNEKTEYRFFMTESHPNYFPELKLGDVVQSEHFTGMVCCVEGKFHIIGTKDEGFAGSARYATSIGSPLFSEGHESLEKLTARCKISGFKNLKKLKTNV